MAGRRKKRGRRRKKFRIPVLILACVIGIFYEKFPQDGYNGAVYLDESAVSAEDVLEDSGGPFVNLSHNIPQFP